MGFAVDAGVGDGLVGVLAEAVGVGLAVGFAVGLPDADGLPLADGDAFGDADTDADGDTDPDGDTDADGERLGLVNAEACGVGDGFGAGGGAGRQAFVAAPSTPPSADRLKTGFGAATMPSATARAAKACGAPWSATDRLSACT